MTTNDAQTEQEFIASQRAKTSRKGFAPAKKPNPKPPTAAPESTQHPIASLQSTTGIIQEAMGSMAGYSAQSTQALATQREVIADRVADQMAALLDPDLFLQDVMERTVAKLNQRTVEIPNFFDISLELPPAPTLKQLTVATESHIP